MELPQFASSILGGSSHAVDAAAMRAARLARLDAHTNIRPSNLVFSQEQTPNSDGIAVANEEAPKNSATSSNPELVDVSGRRIVHVAVTEFAQQSHAGAAPVRFESLPEGAFLRITAQLDLCSSGALVAASGGTGDTLPAALGALRGALEKAREDARSATTAIEAERAADRARHAAQSHVMAQAMAILTPLRTGRAAQTHGQQLQQIFGMLEQGANGQSQREPEFQMREAQAAAALAALDGAARSHVAAGDLHAITA